MRIMILAWALQSCLPGQTRPAEPQRVELTQVSGADYQKTLAAHRGKTVVVYIWGDYSVPDIQWLEEVVALHQRLAGRPIAFITVCHAPLQRDEEDERVKRREHNLKVLVKKKVHLQNLLCAGTDKQLEEKFGFVSGPTFVIYDNWGHKVRRFSLEEGDYRIEDVEKLVRKLAASE
ncbi:MAG: TlpA family protein disulfide reductase [Gemmataceae bacterium]